MAITQAGVDLGGILRFIEYLRSPSQGDVLSQLLGTDASNPFQAAMATQPEIAAGQQPGPTREAASRAGAATGMGPRQLLERMLQQPQLLSDLSSENFDRLVGIAGGLAELEPTPASPTAQQQNLAAFQEMFPEQPITPQLAQQALNLAPTPTSGLLELEAINAARTAQGLPPYGIEEGLRLIKNMEEKSGTTVTVSPTIEIGGFGELIAPFVEKSQVATREDAISRLRFTLPQLERAKKVLETPGAVRWIANPVGQQVLNAIALGQDLSGFTLLEGLDSATLGDAQAALETGITTSAAEIARVYENDISEPTRRRLESVAQMGNLLSTPDRALGAIQAIETALDELSDDKAQELIQGGVTVQPSPAGPSAAPGAPVAPLPKVSADFKARVEAAADRLLRSNPKRYPRGAKDPQLLRDAVSAVRKRVVVRAVDGPAEQVQPRLPTGNQP